MSTAPIQAQDLAQAIDEIGSRISEIGEASLTCPTLKRKISSLTEQSRATDFWDDPRQAQVVMRRLTRLQEQVDKWRIWQERTTDLQELLTLAVEEDDAGVVAEVAADTNKLRHELDAIELSLMLDGPHDASNAILSVYAREGGTEAQDWAQMLMRMYLRWAEDRGYGTEILDLADGDEAGIKSVTILIKGLNAFGYAHAEQERTGWCGCRLLMQHIDGILRSR